MSVEYGSSINQEYRFSVSIDTTAGFSTQDPALSFRRHSTQKNAAPQTYCLHCFPRSFVLLSSIVVRQLCLVHQVRTQDPSFVCGSRKYPYLPKEVTEFELGAEGENGKCNGECKSPSVYRKL